MADFIKITIPSGKVKWINKTTIDYFESSNSNSGSTYIGLTPSGSYNANESVTDIIRQLHQEFIEE